MKTSMPLVGTILLAATAIGVFFASPFGAGAAPSGSASASASASSSADVKAAAIAAARAKIAAEQSSARAEASAARARADAYKWPTTASPEPAAEEWAKATELSSFKTEPQNPGSAACKTYALREWVKIECLPSSANLIGVIWGMAGDLSTTKGEIPSSKDMERFKGVRVFDAAGALERQMGASAMMIFQMKPGAALVLAVDTISADEQYEGPRVLSAAPLVLIDASWAAGEPGATINIR